jgi:hypothetical protein
MSQDESCTGGVWAAGFDYVTARFHLARVVKLIFFLGGGAAVNPR